MHPNTAVAIAAGRRRWVERMRAAKARGEIERFPGGRRARGLPRLSHDPTIRRAQRLLEKAMSAAGDQVKEQAPWETLSKVEKLGRAADLALDCARQILEIGIDAKDAKVLAIVKDTALTLISQQIRLDELRTPRNPNEVASEEERQRLQEERRRRAVEEIDRAFPERQMFDRQAPVIEHQAVPTAPAEPAESAPPVVAENSEEPPSRPREYARPGPLAADPSVERLPVRYRPPRPLGGGWGG